MTLTIMEHYELLEHWGHEISVSFKNDDPRVDIICVSCTLHLREVKILATQLEPKDVVE